MRLVINGDYEVCGLREEGGYIEGGYDRDTAHFFGVYVRSAPDPDGIRLAIHIADFNRYEDAFEYVNFKGAQHEGAIVNAHTHDTADHTSGQILQLAQNGRPSAVEDVRLETDRIAVSEG